jgi:cobalt-precorrin 5A hydrolase / precorrin-3B C17-methyltransferase
MSKRKFTEKSDFTEAQCYLQVLWIGIGCQKNTSKNLIKNAIERTCERYHLAKEAIAGLATIDTKSDEAGILEICREWNLPLKIYSAKQLSQVNVPTPSEVVNNKVKTFSVAEASAILAIQEKADLQEKSEYKALWTKELLVSKQIYKQSDEIGAVTIAIAQTEEEHLVQRSRGGVRQLKIQPTDGFSY